MTPVEYLDLIRKLPCLICSGKSDPHHLDHIGMGRKRLNELPEHFTAIPLCREHHTEIHNRGIGIFNVKYGIDVWKECSRLLISLILNK